MRKTDKEWMAEFDQFMSYANEHGRFVKPSDNYELWHHMQQIKGAINRGVLSELRLYYIQTKFPIFADVNLNWKQANAKFQEEWKKQRSVSNGADV